eukprot:TRINITY_DN26814_c0_g1_i1.p1 TRINITY_DN26814_c0_g1~~TRINITY_DN26814_c0_g1_i1.p1  ORF type:complete len:428 (+),score=84.64 TRINITY_DN26814_c0_g1_i1:150-1286(+)
MGEDNKSKDFLKMNPMGKVPVLEIPGKGAIFESNAIAWYLAATKREVGLLGRNALEEAQVKQWMDFTSNELVPPAITWLAPIMGFREYDETAHQNAVANIKKVFDSLNTVFGRRTYLVGDRFTLADITLASSLCPLYQMVIEPRFRTPFVNLNRWFETVCNNPAFMKVKECSQSAWCVVAQQPKKTKKVEKKPEPKKEAPKEEAKPEAAAEGEEEAPKEEKKKNPLDLLPKSNFILDEFKRTYSNTKDYASVVQYLTDNFDKEGYSMWWCNYKYNADLTKVFMSANLIGGWFQRMDRMHKYGFGIVLIVGDEKTGTKITGWWILRGQEIPEIMSCVDDVELYEWTKFDFADDVKPRIQAFMAWDPIDGQEVQDGKCFK